MALCIISWLICTLYFFHLLFYFLCPSTVAIFFLRLFLAACFLGGFYILDSGFLVLAACEALKDELETAICGGPQQSNQYVI